MKKGYFIAGIILFILGTFFLTPLNKITGFYIIEEPNSSNTNIAGISFIFAGLFSFWLSRDKKGQAAIEFLMTYGWAFLAAVISIGVLAYFGVFSPDEYSVGYGLLSAPFYLTGWNVNESEINLEMRNSGESSYIIEEIKITYSAGACFIEPNVTMASGETRVFTIPCSLSIDTLRGDISVRYREITSKLALASTGTFTDRVARGSNSGGSPPGEPPQYTLTIIIEGLGQVDCDGGVCEESYSGGEVNLLATAFEGYSFTMWIGESCDGSSNPECILEMTEDRTITALFSEDPGGEGGK